MILTNYIKNEEKNEKKTKPSEKLIKSDGKVNLNANPLNTQRL